eukprot:1766608-Rhodomonas_salina.1
MMIRVVDFHKGLCGGVLKYAGTVLCGAEIAYGGIGETVCARAPFRSKERKNKFSKVGITKLRSMEHGSFLFRLGPTVQARQCVHARLSGAKSERTSFQKLVPRVLRSFEAWSMVHFYFGTVQPCRNYKTTKLQLPLGIPSHESRSCATATARSSHGRVLPVIVVQMCDSRYSGSKTIHHCKNQQNPRRTRVCDSVGA